MDVTVRCVAEMGVSETGSWMGHTVAECLGAIASYPHQVEKAISNENGMWKGRGSRSFSMLCLGVGMCTQNHLAIVIRLLYLSYFMDR